MFGKRCSLFPLFVAVLLLICACGNSHEELVDRLDLLVGRAGAAQLSDEQMVQIVGKYNGLVTGINNHKKDIPYAKLMRAQTSCDTFRKLIGGRGMSVTLVPLLVGDSGSSAAVAAPREVVPPSGSSSDGGRNVAVSERPKEIENGGILTGEEIFNKYNSAVFKVYNYDGSGMSGCQGSGFFISSDGLAVSNYHVFKGYAKGRETIELYDGSTYKIESVVGHGDMSGEGGDYNDFIVFKVSLNGSHVNYIPIADHLATVGQTAYAIGSPRGLKNTFSSGMISQIRDSDGHKIYQISVPIDHGSSGGVLLNQYGRAIGITSSGIDSSSANLNFAVDIHEIDYLIK